MFNLSLSMGFIIFPITSIFKILSFKFSKTMLFIFLIITFVLISILTGFITISMFYPLFYFTFEFHAIITSYFIHHRIIISKLSLTLDLFIKSVIKTVMINSFYPSKVLSSTFEIIKLVFSFDYMCSKNPIFRHFK